MWKRELLWISLIARFNCCIFHTGYFIVATPIEFTTYGLLTALLASLIGYHFVLFKNLYFCYINIEYFQLFQQQIVIMWNTFKFVQAFQLVVFVARAFLKCAHYKFIIGGSTANFFQEKTFSFKYTKHYLCTT